MMSQDKNTENKKTKMTSKQIFAIIGIILLVLLYVVTLFAAMGVVSGIKKRSRPEWLIN
jgi:flagellar basal body-associated protein FliL